MLSVLGASITRAASFSRNLDRGIDPDFVVIKVLDIGVVGRDPFDMLWRVTNAWQAAQRRALKPFGLTHVQFVLLASLTWIESDTPVTQQVLAARARTDPMMTSQVLRTLEAMALIERPRHPHDGRARVLAVTPAGRELANRANEAVERCDRDFFSTLGTDRVRFTRMLAQLI